MASPKQGSAVQPTDEFAQLKRLAGKVSGAGLEQMGREFDDRMGMDHTAHVHFRRGRYILDHILKLPPDQV